MVKKRRIGRLIGGMAVAIGICAAGNTTMAVTAAQLQNSHTLSNSTTAETQLQRQAENGREIVYIASQGADTGNGSADQPVRTIEKALELVAEQGTIVIQDNAISEQRADDAPLCITKVVTIKGGELTLSRGGIVLGADVTLEELSLVLKNPVRNAILANGYTLTLQNVKKGASAANPIHLFCGTLTGYEQEGIQTAENTIPEPGTYGRIVISGKDNKLGDIFAGSLSEPESGEEGTASKPGKDNTWTGDAAIILEKGAGGAGTIGSCYAHGATEPRGEREDTMRPDSSKYRVEGKVKIACSGTAPAFIDGATGMAGEGEHTNAHVQFTGEGGEIANVTLQGVASLTVVSGIFKPKALNENVDVAIMPDATLNAGDMIADDSTFTVHDFTGGGVLAMGRRDKLCITGAVSQTTTFVTNEYRTADTSGMIICDKAYIDVTKASGEGSFTFTPYFTQKGVALEKVTASDGTTAWTIIGELNEDQAQLTDFVIPNRSYSVLLDREYGCSVEVPVQYSFQEDNSSASVPLLITISKDGATPVTAQAYVDEESETVTYSATELGFLAMEQSFNVDTWEDVLAFTMSDTIQPGIYEITVAVTLADGTLTARAITLAVKEHERLAGYTLSLDGNIGIHFFLELSDALLADKDAYLQFTRPDGTATRIPLRGEDGELNSQIQIEEKEDKQYYIFSGEVASYEMTKEITAQLFFGENTCSRYSYKVQDYAEYIIKNPSASYREEDILFAKALLNYGAASQAYFQVETDHLANEHLEEADKNSAILETEELSAFQKAAVSNALGTFVGYSLTLQSETTLKVYFQPAAEVDIVALSFWAEGQKVEPVLTKEGYCLSVSNMKAWNLGREYLFEVRSEEADQETLTFSCSALSYAHSVLEKRSNYSEELQRLVSLLYAYYDSARNAYGPKE